MSSPHVTVGNAENFATAVIERSRSRPVLVDFWAAWCAPCRALAPVIDALADRHAGALAVVKVDSDAEAALAGQYAVRSLPTLLLFRDAKVAGQLVGAQPLAALEQFVAPHLPRPADELLVQAGAARSAGDVALACALLEQARLRDASDFRIHAELAECYLELGRIDEARALLSALPANVAVSDSVQRLVARLNLAAGPPVDGEDPLGDAYAAARAIAARGDYDQAVPALLELLARGRDWQDGAIRRTLLDIFNVLGNDARVKPWRAQMARTLN